MVVLLQRGVQHLPGISSDTTPPQSPPVGAGGKISSRVFERCALHDAFEERKQALEMLGYGAFKAPTAANTAADSSRVPSPNQMVSSGSPLLPLDSPLTDMGPPED